MKLPPTNSHVFVSYAAGDESVARAVVQELEGSQLRCWIAPRDIIPGSSWAGAIVKAIVDSLLLVVVVSESSVSSQNVLSELTIARDEQVPILPFHTERCKISDDFRYFLSVPQRLYAYEHPLSEALALLRDAVKNMQSVSITPRAAPSEA